MSEKNEHAENLRRVLADFPEDQHHLDAAAAEIERLAARVRELEQEKRPAFDRCIREPDGPQMPTRFDPFMGYAWPKYPDAAEDGKLYKWVEVDPGHESKPDQETRPVHNCGLPWTLPKLRGLGDPTCPACEATAPAPSPSRSQP